MRYLLWERDEQGAPPAEMPREIIDATMRFIRNALAVRPTGDTASTTEGQKDA